MGQRKPYNPYTQYGRRKLREQAYRNIENYSPEEKEDYNKFNCGCQIAILIAFIIACVLIYLIAGEEALMDWLK